MQKDIETTVIGTDKKYSSFSVEFNDPWENIDVSESFRFSRPTMADIKKMQETANKNGALAQRNLLISCVHQQDKEKLISCIEQHVGVATALAGDILKGVGIGSNLGN